MHPVTGHCFPKEDHFMKKTKMKIKFSKKAVPLADCPAGLFCIGHTNTSHAYLKCPCGTEKTGYQVYDILTGDVIPIGVLEHKKLRVCPIRP